MLLSLWRLLLTQVPAFPCFPRSLSRNDVAYSEKPVYRALASPQGQRITGTDPVDAFDHGVDAVEHGVEAVAVVAGGTGGVEAVDEDIDAVQWWLLARFDLRGLGPLHEC